MIRDRELRVESVPLSEIKPYDGNAKIHTNEQIDSVEASIKEFGFANPVLLWHNGDSPEIVAGHARCIAAQNLGMSHVPAIFLDDLTDAQRRALTLVDNHTVMMTGWDMDQLSYELDIVSDLDMERFGFDVDLSEMEFMEFDGEGDGGGSFIRNGDRLRIVVGPRVIDVPDKDGRLYRAAGEASEDRLRDAVLGILEGCL